MTNDFFISSKSCSFRGTHTNEYITCLWKIKSAHGSLPISLSLSRPDAFTLSLKRTITSRKIRDLPENDWRRGAYFPRRNTYNVRKKNLPRGTHYLYHALSATRGDNIKPSSSSSLLQRRNICARGGWLSSASTAKRNVWIEVRRV